jgi:hypothetical protein
MKQRSIQKVIYAEIFDMGGIQVRQPLPSMQEEYLDPFVLLHHGHLIIHPDQQLKHAGVGPHPHRGFSPVTYIFKGGINHRDSRGNNQAVFAGGTQWMNSGMGIIHSERPLERELEIIQMWINSPQKNKMDQPYYYPLTKENTSVYYTEDKLAEVAVVTGDLLGLLGPIKTLTSINSAMIHLKSTAKLNTPIPSSHHTFLYLLDGKIVFNGNKIVEGKNMIIFAMDGEQISFEALEPTRALLMSGEPIGESMLAHGPFVMNSEIEIMEAYRDYRMGKMGVLIED